MSASAGLTYSGERFEKYFGDFASRYHFNDMYSGGFYPYGTLEEYWAWWSRQIMLNRYEAGVGANTPGMADDISQSESSIRLHQPGGSLCAKGDRRSGNLYGRGYWKSIKKKDEKQQIQCPFVAEVYFAQLLLTVGESSLCALQ